MTTFLERLKELIGDRSASAFARHCGVPGSNIRSYLLGREPGLENLVRISERCEVLLEWLMTGKGPKYRSDAKIIDGFELVRHHLEGPLTDEKLMDVFVTQVSHIKDDAMRAQAMSNLIQLQKKLGPPKALKKKKAE